MWILRGFPAFPEKKGSLGLNCLFEQHVYAEHLLFFWASRGAKGHPSPHRQHFICILTTCCWQESTCPVWVHWEQRSKPHSGLCSGSCRTILLQPHTVFLFQWSCPSMKFHLHLILPHGFFQTAVSSKISQNTPEICTVLFYSWNGFAMHMAFPFLLLLNMYSGSLWPERQNMQGSLLCTQPPIRAALWAGAWLLAVCHLQKTGNGLKMIWPPPLLGTMYYFAVYISFPPLI